MDRLRRWLVEAGANLINPVPVEVEVTVGQTCGGEVEAVGSPTFASVAAGWKKRAVYPTDETSPACAKARSRWQMHAAELVQSLCSVCHSIGGQWPRVAVLVQFQTR